MNAPLTSGFRELAVLAKKRESSTITSFELAPVKREQWRPFRPGQFLVLRCASPSEGRFVPRTYSVSSPPAETGRYRITVKREAAPSAGLPDGIGSCFLHDEVEVGDILLADGPRGDFVLREDSARPVLLLSGGVGLTPLVSMLHALAADAGRRVFFIHACDNGEVHALADEVDAIAAQHPHVGVHCCYRFPTEADRRAGRFHSEGLVSRELLQSLLPLDDYDVYLCGPPPFMDAIHGLVRSLGIAPDRIATEVFGGSGRAGAARAANGASSPDTAAPPVASPAEATGPLVEFRRSGRSVAWNPAAESLLAFAEDSGLDPEFSCRSGICGTCRTGIIAGEVDYFEEPLDPPGDGQILLCCARPKGNLVLDL
ncbi:2Fe-2S iron-sulfur cluster-binding protein [Bosea sp. BIWAKO-01]|uniref:2Fe-2S iron-sulfur cluster-binding protein n=1 Tax=Bosea sp. BIWAKO-01 TaxID=506668 RepID=UPI000852F01E|nr:2Fe-2S iron-sulfur cluster-binding protein [Bosea sp. BIWAKO-01]GAU85846.1 flavohemoprotein [Bosea sp. BIWAKO-01]